MDFETIIYEKKDGIAVITLNRPERLNSLNQQMFAELRQAVEDAEDDDEVRVVVLTGAGRAFCAGADLGPSEGGERVMRETNPDVIRRRMYGGVHKLIKGLYNLSKPTIAAVNGAAAGAGYDLALVCDIRVGSENARFRVAFTSIGLVTGSGGHWFLPRVVGKAKAAELIFTADFLEARDAEKYGVLNRVVPADDLMKETMALAGKIAKGPPIAIRLDKAMIQKATISDLDNALEMAATNQAICITSEDHKEGVAAFREKREAVFRGR